MKHALVLLQTTEPMLLTKPIIWPSEGPHLFEKAGKNAASPANVVDSITGETDRFGHQYQNA